MVRISRTAGRAGAGGDEVVEMRERSQFGQDAGGEGTSRRDRAAVCVIDDHLRQPYGPEMLKAGREQLTATLSLRNTTLSAPTPGLPSPGYALLAL